jgi:hypothetical protein
LGELHLTDKQAKRLGVKAHTKISPYLEKCCLIVSANVSYQNAAKDVKYLTGIDVSSKTQQRLVHRQAFKLPIQDKEIQELSVDGGKIRLRTPLGEPCIWRDYKGIRLHEQVTEAFFQDAQSLINWVNEQPLASPVTCIGDGHDGIWKIISKIGDSTSRREILDWFHLKENLYKVGGSNKRLKKAEALLWQGKLKETLELFVELRAKQAQNFCDYIEKHRHRIINYSYYSSEQICSVASGAVESAVKQIDRRTKISGAQWNEENVPQVLAHRCAYLNGLI